MSTTDEPTMTETQAALDAGMVMAEPDLIGGDDRFYVVTTPTGAQHTVIDLEELRLRTAVNPARKTGHVTLSTVDAFVEYIKRHETEWTEVYASLDQMRMLAVLDSDAAVIESNKAGRKEHRAELILQSTPAWKAWMGIDRKLLPQVAFAEHIEDRLPDVVTPSGAELLTIAQTFIAKKGLDFESGTRLVDGQTQLVYKETIGASAGKKGELTIPEKIELALAPWLGGDTYKVTARVRYRIGAEGLGIGIVIDRPEDVLRDAFDGVVSAVNLDITAPVFAGWPSR